MGTRIKARVNPGPDGWEEGGKVDDSMDGGAASKGGILTISTPPKTNMEPEKDGFQKESPFPGVHFQVPC